MKKFLALCLLYLIINVPLQGKEYLIVRDNNYNHGLFSCFTTNIGLLDLYDKGECAGLEVNYRNKGIYYEQKKGLNWWTYYFKPLKLGNTKNATKSILSSQGHVDLALKTLYDLPKERIHSLIKKYIKVRKPINKEINRFVKNNFGDSFIIGVHYRGTDKNVVEAPRLKYERLYEAVVKLIGEVNQPNYRIFIATDEAQLIDYMKAQFPDRIVCLPAIRSSDGNPLHYAADNKYRKGKEAVMDCLLLSRCHYLIRTSSNLSLCSTYFNPNIPVLLLNPGVLDRTGSP